MKLYEQQTHNLLCPCHQSTFNAADGAKVKFGPAARPLPQLAISVDDEGYFVAQGDFNEPVGPSYWERSVMSQHDGAAQPIAHHARRQGRAGTATWVDDRLGSSNFVRRSLNKVFPDHWSFMLGEIALYSFIILLLTGTYLTFFYEASTREVVYNGSYLPLKGIEMSRRTPRRWTSASTSAAVCSCGRSTTGRPCCSWRRSWCTCSACSSPARSASRAR